MHAPLLWDVQHYGELNVNFLLGSSILLYQEMAKILEKVAG